MLLKDEKLLAILRLQKTKNIGDILAKKLIATVGDVQGIFNEKPQVLSKIHGLGQLGIQSLFDSNTLKRAEIELDYIKRENINYTYFLDNQYPRELKHCIDGPILFFYDGNINLTNQRFISIVGTRNISHYGRELCQTLVRELKPYKPLIVSGFAYGVDIEVHKAAIANQLETIGVYAHGFEHVYPKSHKPYIHKINKKGGFITEFWHDEKPLRENFLKRNRIVAGISKATVIIESAERGGSLVTADIANSYAKDVFAFPGKTTDHFSKGCNQLIKNNKAHLIESATDIVNMLQWDQSFQEKEESKDADYDLSIQEKKIYECLRKNGSQLMDLIALETGIAISEIATLLLQMELKGIIKPLPGKQFSLVS